MKKNTLPLRIALIWLISVTSIVPVAQAQWAERNNGLFGGIINALTTNGSNVYAGTTGGVFLSTTNGATWTAAGLKNLTVKCFATSGTSLFAGTVEAGVFLTNDNGATWTAVTSGLANTYIFSLAISGTNIFAGTLDGVFLSINNGTSWTPAGLANNYIYSLTASGSNVYAGTIDGVLVSNDNGITWASLGVISGPIVSMLVNDTTIFASTGSETFFHKTMASIGLLFCL